MSDTDSVKGSDLIQRLKKLAQQRNQKCWVDHKRGKGSHATLYFGERFTIIRNPKDELKTGTLHAMLKQLGVDKNDI